MKLNFGSGLSFDRIKVFLLRVGGYIVKKVLVFCAGFTVLVGLTFLFTKNFSVVALSDRLVWCGLLLFLASGLVWLGVFVAGGQFGVSGRIRTPDEAKKFFAHQAEMRETIEKRYDAAIQIWVIGLGCIIIGALVQIIFGGLG